MNRVSIVLHRSIYPRNVGMCARAMANMGLERLVLVAPRFEPGHDEAKQGAAHAQEILRNAIVYPDLMTFLASEGSGLHFALSGKDHRLQTPDELETTFTRIKNDPESPIHDRATAVALHFGPEDDGLSSEEMAIANHVCRLPTFSEITSLNLSHAVLLASFILRQALADESNATVEIRREANSYPNQLIHEWLEALGFDLSAPRVSIEKTLNRIILSRCPSSEELRLLNTVLHQTVRKLAGSNKPRSRQSKS